MFLVTTVVFVLLHMAPGDPFSASLEHPGVTQEIRQHWITVYGLDKPVLQQYGLYLKNVMTGDLGWSFSLHRPVVDVITQALPYTISLAGIALLVGFLTGIILGVLQSKHVNSRFDKFWSAVSMTFHSIPDFWLAILLMLIFAYWIPILPAGGAVDPVLHEYLSPTGQLLDRLKHLILPALTLSTLAAATVMRYQRAEMLRVLPQEYIQTARAKGLNEGRVIWRHALRNALLPAISLLGLMLPLLFTGAVFVEKIFAWPGMGWIIVNAVFMRDYPLVTAGVVIMSFTVALGSAIADILYALADPRVAR